LRLCVQLINYNVIISIDVLTYKQSKEGQKVEFRDTKEKSAQHCGMCGTKNGEERPVGKIIVQVKPAIYKGKQDYLCQTCFVLNNSEITRKEGHLAAKKQLKWYQRLLKIGFISKKTNE
jgi:hypothetical protein